MCAGVGVENALGDDLRLLLFDARCVRNEVVVGELRYKYILVDATVNLFRHIVERRSLKAMRSEYNLCIGVIANDACHHRCESIALGVDMNDVLAFLEHTSESHWAVEVPNAFKR